MDLPDEGMQQLARGSMVDFDVSVAEDESYLERIVLVEKVVVAEMTSPICER